jgi:hypothetical protein
MYTVLRGVLKLGRTHKWTSINYLDLVALVHAHHLQCSNVRIEEAEGIVARNSNHNAKTEL